MKKIRFSLKNFVSISSFKHAGTYLDISAFKETSCLIAEDDRNRLFAEGNNTKVWLFDSSKH